MWHPPDFGGGVGMGAGGGGMAVLRAAVLPSLLSVAMVVCLVALFPPGPVVGVEAAMPLVQ